VSTWVLLRGWAREARHWGDFPRLLEAAVHPDTVLALDLPGAGALRTERSPVAVAGIVERCRRALVEHNVPPPYHLLGLSLGGMVAIEWAARNGAEVESCVLLNTSARPFCAFYERLQWRRILQLVRIVLTAEAAERERAILALVSTDDRRRVEALPPWTRYAEQAPMRFANALRQVIAAARYRAPERPPSVPLLLLAGRGDRLVDPGCSENLARRWKAPLVVHPTAGHDLALDAGTWVAAEVASWLRAGDG
jgi:pimeloyl-ACP methyl ester carboxylesterase